MLPRRFSKLDKAKVRLIKHSPFFSTLLLGTKIVEDKTLPTAATDGLTLWVNPDFIESLSVETVMFVLAHEVSHIMFEHSLRLGKRDQKLFNAAADYAINWLLYKEGFAVWDQALLDEKYAGMSAEKIYELLLTQQREKPSGDDPQDGLGDDLRPPPRGTTPEKVNQTVQRRVAQAATVARMAGKMGADLDRFVNGVLNPAVSCVALLRDYMLRICKDDESWGKRNRRYRHTYLPSRHSEAMGEVIFIGDTSGSVTEDDIRMVAGEIGIVSETLKPERIRMVWADTQIAGEQVFEQGEPIMLAPRGGGGTDMRVPLEYVTQYDPEVVVLITDGYTPWPASEPDYPLIVCCTTDVDVPVGSIIRMKG
jgi:predicted metal-dependent peptidase